MLTEFIRVNSHLSNLKTVTDNLLSLTGEIGKANLETWSIRHRLLNGTAWLLEIMTIDHVLPSMKLNTTVHACR